MKGGGGGKGKERTEEERKLKFWFVNVQFVFLFLSVKFGFLFVVLFFVFCFCFSLPRFGRVFFFWFSCLFRFRKISVQKGKMMGKEGREKRGGTWKSRRVGIFFNHD